jgi:putative phosphoesterase
MKRIGLLSDTHGWLDPRLQEHFAACDEVWHAGDIGDPEVMTGIQRWQPGRVVRAVHGNIDGGVLRNTHPADQRFELEGVRVWMTHIGGRPPKYDRSILPLLRSDPPTLFICGHSHICLVQFDPALDCLYMNPGAAGRHGWHQMRTALRFTMNNGRPADLEVIELGRRSSS